MVTVIVTELPCSWLVLAWLGNVRKRRQVGHRVSSSAPRCNTTCYYYDADANFDQSILELEKACTKGMSHRWAPSMPSPKHRDIRPNSRQPAIQGCMQARVIW